MEKLKSLLKMKKHLFIQGAHMQLAQQYIQKHIIHIAKYELEHSELTIKEIAYRLGFKYPQHFSRLFKKKTGFTPHQYKLKQKIAV